MIKIHIPNNNINEREYIIDIIFDKFLGLTYKLAVNDKTLGVSDWKIELENGNKLIFEDHFFNKYPKVLEYLRFENIPSKVEFVKNKFTPEKEIPAIYGNLILDIKNSSIVCGVDIFASSFFMLTRWEEYVNKNRDSHDRFPATESLAFKNNFLDRPIVNEYVGMLKNMLLELGLDQKPKTKNYQLFLTHDVDDISKWNTLVKFIKHLAGDLILRKSIKEFFLSISYYIQVKLGIKNDPYDTFDELMDLSDKAGIKSYFFFMGRGITRYDNRYKTDSKEAIGLVSKIKKRGHHIGIHPTYGAYDNTEQFQKEKKELEKNFGANISFGREHYLRFEIPITWQVWEDNKMDWDSTLGYADKEGFRAGVCYEYNVFNILTRKKLNLKEKPLIVMETSIKSREEMTPEKMEIIIKDLINKIKKYNGDFVFLWHNSNFNIQKWRDYRNVYERVLKGVEKPPYNGPQKLNQ